MSTKKNAQWRIPPVVAAVFRPISSRLLRMENLLIDMRAEQEMTLKKIRRLQERVDELTEAFQPKPGSVTRAGR